MGNKSETRPYENNNADDISMTDEVTIMSYSNGNVAVNNFPANPARALEIMLLGIKAITEYFIDAAIDGKIMRDPKVIAVSHASSISRLN